MRRSQENYRPRPKSNPPALKCLVAIMQPVEQTSNPQVCSTAGWIILFPQLKSQLLTQKVERVAKERAASPRGPSSFWSHSRFRQLLFRCEENRAYMLGWRWKTIRNITCCRCTLCNRKLCHGKSFDSRMHGCRRRPWWQWRMGRFQKKRVMRTLIAKVSRRWSGSRACVYIEFLH